jgi:hypothetical protein
LTALIKVTNLPFVIPSVAERLLFLSVHPI